VAEHGETKYVFDLTEVPDIIKKHKGKRVDKELKDQGFEGQMISDKRTGRCKQYYEEGSYFDGYMRMDELVRGKFYFANGDFFEGEFAENELKSGTYIKAEKRLEVIKATFEGGELTGTPESLSWTTGEGLKCMYKGELAASRPHGKGMLQYGDKIASGNWTGGVLSNESSHDNAEE